MLATGGSTRRHINEKADVLGVRWLILSDMKAGWCSILLTRHPSRKSFDRNKKHLTREFHIICARKQLLSYIMSYYLIFEST